MRREELEDALVTPTAVNASSVNVDPDDETIPTMQEDTKLRKFRRKVRKFVESLPLRILTILVLIADVVVVIIGLATDSDDNQDYEIVSIVFVTYFGVELLLRIFARGRNFFRKWYEVLDTCIIIVSIVLTIVYVELNGHSYVKLITLARVVRFVLWFRIFTEHKQLQAASRHMVSQNKRRYREDGFDLDLTYVTDRVIAMSFPSSGKMGFYRNPIREVVRLLDTKHANHYKVYNLCSEKAYDSSHFHGNVERILIDDHTVPPIKEIVRFCENVQKWMESDPKNVIAIHCRGGKGRSGTMVCAYLLRAGLFDRADECLEYFGKRRTDFLEGSKFQGVETPSQQRYVEYYNFILKNGGVVPEPIPLRIRSIQIDAIKGVGMGDGSDLRMQVLDSERRLLLDVDLNSTPGVEPFFNSGEDFALFNFKDDVCPLFSGDVAIKFHCRTKVKLRKLYGHCLFFFHFNTGFVGKETKLRLTRQELDNPHKKKTHAVFRPEFAVELYFV
ncbi:phosphatidylinositol 3,4,5-trisphosphate 3-phosphatase TPTE2-like isoform X2 [Oscarella lobularis]|uniref:phosphatidylinositol 3,4,5-trisphosphate 3-phosphatase TPTE2-like isoform X2 n=1 Tax=Oscarella lobularis TaxID=121494 RepID=UPI0033131861